ncbi:Na/Pi cotransporter family protein [Stomatobaculum longum]|jgi:Na/Pi-cotransporter II-like protein|uniref:Na/Pi cotransporter family protein n=1 Tax=Stomatobaculum longum TaxID=796942 RepID=UPI001CB286F5|nr:Na/Pi cotransporter family protein [Stomatobaculum longum]MBF1256156.1 Na/Pi cotransporter family protein [Stomatobaculum longum]
MLDNITNLFLFIGGLGMFLYGMHVMAEGTQKSVGSKMKDFLGMLTSNRLKAVLVGTLITGIIQSSGATTVMVVGFVSAGLMTLSQAVGVIMGANIGTTVTAWIVSLSQIGDSMKFLNPEFYAPVLIGIGAGIIMFSKSDTKKNRAEIIIGFGLLFQGLKFMSESVAPYTDAPIFATVFTTLGTNPFLGILAGAVVTALLQSSSVSVGILQMLAGNGLIMTNAAIFITLGENIGSCVTAMLSSIGGSRDARRAAVIHLSFNMIGALLFTVISILLFALKPTLAHYHISPVQISMFHTGFKLTMTVLLFPFGEQLVKLSGMLVPEKQALLTGEKKEEELVTHLDPRIFEQPAIAVAALSNAVATMGKLTLRNVERACEVCFTQDEAVIAEIFETEKKINAMNRELSEYLIKANTLPVNDHQRLVVADLFNTLTDLERSGDHAENVAKEVQLLMTRQLTLSETGKKDLRDMTDAVQEAFRCAVKAREERSVTSARKVSACEDLVDSLRDEQKERHMDRLSRGECKPEAGLVFIEIIDNLERISDHAQNMAEYIMNEI